MGYNIGRSSTRGMLLNAVMSLIMNDSIFLLS